MPRASESTPCSPAGEGDDGRDALVGYASDEAASRARALLLRGLFVTAAWCAAEKRAAESLRYGDMCPGSACESDVRGLPSGDEMPVLLLPAPPAGPVAALKAATEESFGEPKAGDMMEEEEEDEDGMWMGGRPSML